MVAALGAGGMGEVYKARDTRLERTVALKILPAEFSEDAARRARFAREAKTISQLTHPHICTLHDIGEAPAPDSLADVGAGVSRPSVQYLVMEYLEGQTLAQRLGKGRVPMDEALRIGAEIADALAAAHRRGVIHRDLKPSNVMLVRDGGTAAASVKLLDFGLAKPREHALFSEGPEGPTETDSLTAEGALVGTLPYMAPEQVEGKAADERTDIWALGAILYEMLAGKRPFEGTSSAGLIGAILEREPEPLAVRQPLTPPALDRLVQTCLAKDLDSRRQSAADLAGELRWLASRRVGRRRWGGAAVAVGLFILAVLALWDGRQTATPAALPHPRTALAVLPFENLITEEQGAYFAGGLHEEVQTQLGKVSGLRVISRTSVMRYAGEDTPPLIQIARELGVGSVVEGTVQVVGDRLRVHVSLVDAASGIRVWANSYDGALNDVFAIQGDIAGQIVSAVGAVLTPAEQQRLAAVPTANATAYRLYLRATELGWGVERTANAGAEELLQQALTLDPEFAVATALLAHVHIARAYNFGESRRWADSGLGLARAAIARDPDLALGHSAVGMAQLEAGRLAEAFAAFEHELEVSPNASGAMLRLGWVHFLRGGLAEAVELWTKARQLDPANAMIPLDLGAAAGAVGDFATADREFQAAQALAANEPELPLIDPSPYVRQASIARALRLGKTSDAVTEAERFVTDQPTSFLALQSLVQARLHAGSYDLARPHLEAMRRLGFHDWDFWGLTYRTLHGWTLLKLGDRRGGTDMLHEVLEDARSRIADGDERPGLLREIAAAYAALGDRESAFEWFEQAISAGWRLERLRPSPLLEVMRAEPRYRQLTARIDDDLRRMRVRIQLGWTGRGAS